MSKEQDNKAIVGRWFTSFWGPTCDLSIVDELAAPDMLLQYSLHELRRGHADIKAFMTDFRGAFPDLSFGGAADLIAEGDYVVGRWIGGGTHTGPAFSDFLAGSLPDNKPIYEDISASSTSRQSKHKRQSHILYVRVTGNSKHSAEESIVMKKQFDLKRLGSGSYRIRCIDFPGGQACKGFTLRPHLSYFFPSAAPNSQIRGFT